MPADDGSAWVLRLDAAGDDTLLARWHAVLAEAERAEVGEAAAVWTLPELVETLGPGGRTEASAHVLVDADGAVLAAGLLQLPRHDNLDSAEVHVGVAPALRRRGHGSALLAHLEAAAAERGRTRLDAEVAWPHDVGPDPAGTPGHDFAVRHGYRFGLGDVQRELRLPVAADLLDALAAEAAPHHAQYEVRGWGGPVPDGLVAGWLALQSTLMTEAPTGTMERETESVDAAAHREAEALQARQGRTSYHAIALSPAGEVVAYTQLVTTVHEPDRAYQWGTLVRRDHRGHRLGLAVKVAALRLLQRQAPAVATVRTWNAEENAPMVGVNERLGFVPVARLAELQKRLPPR